MKINQPRPSLPVTQRNTEPLPQRPPPRQGDDGFETTKSGPVSLGAASLEATPGEQVIALAKSVMGKNAHDLKLSAPATTP